MMSLLFVLFAIAEDSGCPENSEQVQAQFQTGTCTNSEPCSRFPEGRCPTWEQTLSQCVGDTHWACIDCWVCDSCSNPSEIGHMAMELAPTYRAAYYYNNVGEQVGYHVVYYEAPVLCCEGQPSLTYAEGSGGECLYPELVRGEVEASGKEKPCGGCAGEQAVLWVGIAALLGGGLSRWRRA